MAKLSVIVPVYNVEDCISRCVESILNQTFYDLEVILVNDGSNDSSGLICDSYAIYDKRVKVIHKVNGGVSSARNIGIDNAEGEFITFVDSDDWLELDAYETILKCIKFAGSEIGAFGMNIDFGKGSYETKSSLVILDRRTAMKEQIKGELYKLSVCDKIFRKEIIGDNRFNSSLTMGEDLLFSWESISKCSRLVYISDYKYNYVQRSGSICNRDFSPKQITDIFVWHKIYQDTYSDKEMRDFAFEKYIYCLLSRSLTIVKSGKIKYENIFNQTRDTYIITTWKRILTYNNIKIKYKFLVVLFLFVPYRILIKIYNMFSLER